MLLIGDYYFCGSLNSGQSFVSFLFGASSFVPQLAVSFTFQGYGKGP